MAGKIPPQFLKNVKGATKQGGPTDDDDTKKNAKLPDFLKKGSKDQEPKKGENPFAEKDNPFSKVVGKKGAKGKKLSAAEKKKLADKARKDAAKKAFADKED